MPAVIAGGGSVFATPAATSGSCLLEALEQPHRSRPGAGGGADAVLRRTPPPSSTSGGDAADRPGRRHAARAGPTCFAPRGVAARARGRDTRRPDRPGCSPRVGGERHADRPAPHRGGAARGRASTSGSGSPRCSAWLRAQVAEDAGRVAAERTRRLDSDAAAVQLVTDPRQQGPAVPRRLPARRSADRSCRRRRRAAVPRRRRASAASTSAAAGAGWATTSPGAGPRGGRRVAAAALRRADPRPVAGGRLVGADRANTAGLAAAPDALRPPARHGRRCPTSAPTSTDDEVAGGPRPLAGGRRAGRREPAPTARPAGRRRPRASVPTLAVRRFTRAVDTAWRRTSYSVADRGRRRHARAAGRRQRARGPAAEDDDGSVLDASSPPPSSPTRVGRRCPRRWPSCRSGATFGSLVHAVLEHADPDAPDLAAPSCWPTSHEQLVWWPVDARPRGARRRAGRRLRHPARAARGRRTLREIALARPAAELDFELPLAAATTSCRPATSRSATSRRCCAATCPRATRCAPTPTRSSRPGLGDQTLRGYLTGSVDVVLRVRDGGRATSSSTTRPTGSATRDEPAHRPRLPPAALDAAMAHSDYPLQALLYAVVLHRYLRWRLPGYDPATHLGGVLYLYLRGMCGPETPLVDGEPCGVFAWRPPVALVEDAVRPARRGRSRAMTELFEPVDDHDRAPGRSAPTGCSAPSTGRRARGRRRPRRHPARPRSAARPTRGSLLAVALAVRAVRAGSVCVDLATVADLPVDARPAVARARRPGASAVARQPARRGRGAAARARPALPRPLPPPGGAGLRRPRRPRRRSRRRRSTSRALAAALDRVFPDGHLAPSSAAPPRRGRGSGPPSSPAGPAPARPPPWPGCSRCSPTRRQARGERLRIALAAPTGKAAARLQEAVDERARAASATPTGRGSAGLEAMTLHRLLGWRPTTPPASGTTAATGCPTTWSSSTRPRWSSLTMMARLLEAVRPDARLVLVGDPDQLTSVDAGAVLADLVDGLRRRPRLARSSSLTTTYRFGERHQAARRGAARRRRRRGAGGARAPAPTRSVRRDRRRRAARCAATLLAAALRGPRGRRAPATPTGAAGRARPAPAAVRPPRGPVRRTPLEPAGRALARRGDRASRSTAAWYAGRPLLVTANDYALGDLQRRDRASSVPAARRRLRGVRSPASARPARLRARPARRRRDHARDDDPQEPGQPGRRVTVLLPDEELAAADPRAVLHRGDPRPATSVRVVGSEAAVRAAVGDPRASARPGCGSGWPSRAQRPRRSTARTCRGTLARRG